MIFGKTVQRGGVFVTHFEKKSVKFFLHFAHCNTLKRTTGWIFEKRGYERGKILFRTVIKII